MKIFTIESICFISALVILVAGCDCTRTAEGIILDKTTREPLDSVIITTVDITKNTITEPVEYALKSGKFRYMVIRGVYYCPDLVLYFYKRGYKTLKRPFPSDNPKDSIWLERSNYGW